LLKVLVSRTITSSILWTVPLDWSNLNTITVIGGGQGGGSYYRWITNSGGGFRLTYGYGGAGAGYVSITNLSVLVPGQTVSIQVGIGGPGRPDAFSSGGGPGGSGGTSLFGSYLQATGGTAAGSFPFLEPGRGSIFNLSESSYTSAVTSTGFSGRLYSGGDPGIGGASGRPGFGGSGNGGNSQNFYDANPNEGSRRSVRVAAQSGTSGVVVISYTPSGTHQSSVWIS
jgi:hypothetical protein